jgi:hypothetical protein
VHRIGQYAIVEHTILIGVGIALAIGFLIAFQTLSGSVEGSATSIETRLLSSYMAANAVGLVESGGNGKITLSLPDDITDNVYAVRLSDSGINVVTTGNTETASLYGLERRLEMDGSVTSQSQSVSLVYADGALSVEGEQ